MGWESGLLLGPAFVLQSCRRSFIVWLLDLGRRAAVRSMRMQTSAGGEAGMFGGTQSKFSRRRLVALATFMASAKYCPCQRIVWRPHITKTHSRRNLFSGAIFCPCVGGKRGWESIKQLQAVPEYYRNLVITHRSWKEHKVRAWSRNLKGGRNDNVDDDDDDIEELSIASGSNGAGIYRLEEGNRVPKETVKNVAQKPEGAKWPLWLLGPLALLATGGVPGLWLPTPTLFSGSTAAGILALAGLDGTFNMGSTVFLLAADTCARGSRHENAPVVVTLHSKTPSGYKVWSILVSTVGLVGPVLAWAASWHGYLLPEAGFLAWASMIGPYCVLLLVQMCVETLVWRWQSPVWPVVPLVYQGYRIFQLWRGIQLGSSLNAPPWLIQVAKGLVSWWVVVLGMQLMWIAWLTGSTRTRSSKQVTQLTVGHVD